MTSWWVQAYCFSSKQKRRSSGLVLQLSHDLSLLLIAISFLRRYHQGMASSSHLLFCSLHSADVIGHHIEATRWFLIPSLLQYCLREGMRIHHLVAYSSEGSPLLSRFSYFMTHHLVKILSHKEAEAAYCLSFLMIHHLVTMIPHNLAESA